MLRYVSIKKKLGNGLGAYVKYRLRWNACSKLASFVSRVPADKRDTPFWSFDVRCGAYLNVTIPLVRLQ